jgi:hypothetical protein
VCRVSKKNARRETDEIKLFQKEKAMKFFLNKLFLKNYDKIYNTTNNKHKVTELYQTGMTKNITKNCNEKRAQNYNIIITHHCKQW